MAQDVSLHFPPNAGGKEDKYQKPGSDWKQTHKNLTLLSHLVCMQRYGATCLGWMPVSTDTGGKERKFQKPGPD